MSRKLLSAAAVLFATALAGCGSGDPTTSSPGPSPATSSPVEAGGPCLFEPAQVASAIPGVWDNTADDDVCTYTSDRGAIFVTTLVDTAVEAGLDASRKACIASPSPVEIGDRAFVCIENHDDGDLVVGNVAIGSRLWSLVIVPDEGVHDAELSAMGRLVEMVADS
ncbi:hypothetical protein [Nocardioides albus]|uniref:DUF3558 domain-containing protein n=1 Tax=Nocardioides albus TaxID=1841 RepID=A0A7W5A5N9_9ACTN|nr:hypothetical protein [Nocardioides albus]MBB3089958.1 hypothetical protein [Nocardioides albus]GGU36836.1 hypothetical protein GCM10007979_40030 [Nocardioides albus]